MVKCPFCGFENEDGVLFCEQCKSDLSSVPTSPAPPPAEVVPMAAIIEDPSEELGKTIPIVPEAMPMASATLHAAEAEPPSALEIPVEALPNLGMGETLPLAEAVPVEPATPAPASAPAAAGFAAGAQPRLKVMRGLKVGVEFPIYSDYNYIGRADEKPVDIDLEDQEPPDRVWCSRQHAVIHFDEAAGIITLEDLNSSNGTYVNRNRVYPGEKKALSPNDVVQIGTVHLKLLV